MTKKLTQRDSYKIFSITFKRIMKRSYDYVSFWFIAIIVGITIGFCLALLGDLTLYLSGLKSKIK